MALQNTGTIRIDDLRTGFNSPDDLSPAPLTHFYRDGSYVPGSIPGNSTPPGPACQTTNDTSYHKFGYQITNNDQSYYSSNCAKYDHTLYRCSHPQGSTNWMWGGAGPCPNGPHGFAIPCSTANAGMAGELNLGGPMGGSPGCRVKFYNTASSPGGSNPPSPINTGVPTSGTIKLSNFYGATK